MFKLIKLICDILKIFLLDEFDFTTPSWDICYFLCLYSILNCITNKLGFRKVSNFIYEVNYVVLDKAQNNLPHRVVVNLKYRTELKEEEENKYNKCFLCLSVTPKISFVAMCLIIFWNYIIP